MVNTNSLWFNTIDAATLCKGGGNGSNHPSQLYAIKKYVYPLIFEDKSESITFLDYGSGSGTTYEALLNNKNIFQCINYLGVDIIPKFTKYCQKTFPEANWEVNPTIHKIDQKDNSWDVVYSRHVVDHMASFEDAVDEHCRVAKQLVIIVLWRPLGKGDEHQIKNITDQGKVYENEYTNDYSRKKVMQKLESLDDWEILEVSEGIGKEVRGFDTVIVLRRKHGE